MKPTMKAVIRGLLFTPIFIASLLSVTAFAFTGMWLIRPDLFFSIAAAAFAVIIEGEVNRVNLNEGLKKLFHWGKYIETIELERKLKRLALAEQEKANDNIFTDYYKLSTRLKKIKKQWHPQNFTELGEKRAEIRRIKTQMAMISDLFRNAVFNPELSTSNDTPSFTKALYAEINDTLGKDKDTLIKTIKSKKRQLWTTSLFSLGGSAVAGLANFRQMMFSAKMILAFLHIGLAASPMLAGIIAPLATLFAIYWAIAIYHTFADIIATDKYQKYKKKIFKLFKKRKQESALRCWTRRILVTVGLAVLLTISVSFIIATAGTIWSAAKSGAKAIPYLSRAARWIYKIGMPLFIGGQFSFGIKNFFESISEIGKTPGFLKKHWHAFEDKIKHTENLGQQLNPFRWTANILEFAGRLVIFTLHIFSIGLTTDHLGKVPPAGTAMAGALEEAGEDIHYIFKSDISVSDIPGLILKTALSPLLLLSGLWHFGFSQLHADSNKKLSFRKAMLWTFGFKIDSKELSTEPTLSHKFLLHAFQQDITYEIERLRSTKFNPQLRNKKIGIFNKLLSDINTKKTSPIAERETTSKNKTSNVTQLLVSHNLWTNNGSNKKQAENYKTLATCRYHHQKTGKTTSRQTLKKIQEKYGDIPLVPAVSSR